MAHQTTSGTHCWRVAPIQVTVETEGIPAGVYGIGNGPQHAKTRLVEYLNPTCSIPKRLACRTRDSRGDGRKHGGEREGNKTE